MVVLLLVVIAVLVALFVAAGIVGAREEAAGGRELERRAAIHWEEVRANQRLRQLTERATEELLTEAERTAQETNARTDLSP